MYKCPIDVIIDDIRIKSIDFDQKIIEAIQDIEIQIDNDELIKALKYDRDQYEKGYADAKLKTKWILCSVKMPQTNVPIFYCTNTGIVGEGRYEGYNGYHEVWKMYSVCGTHWDDEVIAWMPLPEPYNPE